MVAAVLPQPRAGRDEPAGTAIDFPSFHSAHMPSSFYPRQAQPRVLDVEDPGWGPPWSRTCGASPDSPTGRANSLPVPESTPTERAILPEEGEEDGEGE